MTYMGRNLKKFEELMLFFVAKSGERGVVETKLMKLLYFAEAEYFRTQKRTITGVDYFRNNFGPTPDVKVLKNTYDNLGALLAKEKGVVNDKPFTVFRVAKKDFSYGHLTEGEMETTETIFRLYGGLSTGQLIKLSHFDPPYLAARPKNRIDFKFVLYRKDNDQDFEETANKDDQEKMAQDISAENLNRFFDYLGSSSS